MAAETAEIILFEGPGAFENHVTIARAGKKPVGQFQEIRIDIFELGRVGSVSCRTLALILEKRIIVTAGIDNIARNREREMVAKRLAALQRRFHAEIVPLVPCDFLEHCRATPVIGEGIADAENVQGVLRNRIAGMLHIFRQVALRHNHLRYSAIRGCGIGFFLAGRTETDFQFAFHRLRQAECINQKFR